MSTRLLLSKNVLRGAGYVIGLGMVVAWASLSMRLHTRPDTIQNMTHILHGEPVVFGDATSAAHPFYNRVMFPGLLWALAHGVGLLTESQWYILLRIGTVTLGLGAFALTCVHALRVTPRELRLATGMMAISIIAAFGYPWEDPTDVLDVCAQSLGVLAALEDRYLLGLAVAMLFACNRESAAYLGIIWLLLAPGPRPLVRRVAEGAAISLASYAVAMALRLGISKTGAVNWLPIGHNVEALQTAVGHFTFISWLGVMLAVTLFLTCCIDIRESLARRFVALAGILALPAFLFGYIDDLRVFLPCAVMLCFAVAASRAADKEA
jgi:hypothetical protein